MKKTVTLMLAVLMLLLSALTACDDPYYKGTLPPQGEGGVEGGVELPSDMQSIPDLILPVFSDGAAEPTQDPAPEPTPVAPDSEPAEKYTTEWIRWLVNVDQGRSYYKPSEVGLFQSACFEEGMTPSVWELWPYIGGQVSEASSFHMLLTVAASELDGYTDLGTDAYEYTWKVFYREQDSAEDYKSVDMQPISALVLEDTCFYRLNMHDYGQVDMHLKTDGSTNTYHIVIVIVDGQGEHLAWLEASVDWTDSSEAYYREALNQGVVGKE